MASNNNVVRTNLYIQTSDTEFTIPGDMSAAQVKEAYASQIPGLSNMTHEESVTFSEELGGNVRTITFRPRTGTKGSV